MRMTKKAREVATVIVSLVVFACTVHAIEEIGTAVTGLSEEKLERTISHGIEVAIPVAFLGLLIGVATWSFFQPTPKQGTRAKLRLLAILVPCYIYLWLLLFWAMGILRLNWWMNLCASAFFGLSTLWWERRLPSEVGPDQKPRSEEKKDMSSGDTQPNGQWKPESWSPPRWTPGDTKK